MLLCYQRGKPLTNCLWALFHKLLFTANIILIPQDLSISPIAANDEIPDDLTVGGRCTIGAVDGYEMVPLSQAPTSVSKWSESGASTPASATAQLMAATVGTLAAKQKLLEEANKKTKEYKKRYEPP